MSNEKINEILLEIINLPAPIDRIKMINAACRLTLAERERCAEVVVELGNTSKTWAENSTLKGTCDFIADKIREGK